MGDGGATGSVIEGRGWFIITLGGLTRQSRRMEQCLCFYNVNCCRVFLIIADAFPLLFITFLQLALGRTSRHAPALTPAQKQPIQLFHCQLPPGGAPVVTLV